MPTLQETRPLHRPVQVDEHVYLKLNINELLFKNKILTLASALIWQHEPQVI